MDLPKCIHALLQTNKVLEKFHIMCVCIIVKTNFKNILDAFVYDIKWAY